MDSGDAIQLIVLLLLILLSAFFSSAETAMTTVNKIRIMSLADDGNKKAKTLLKIIENPGKLLSTILIGNNIVNLSASSLATTWTTRVLGNAFIGFITGVLTLLILLFGEITPKTLATLQAEKISLAYAPVIYPLTRLLTPVIFFVNLLSRGVLFLLRIDMSLINVDATYDEVIQAFREDGYTRYPVYENSTDTIIGTLNMKDLILRDPEKPFSVRDFLRNPYFTYEYKGTADLLMEMKEYAVNLAIVLDEYGATAGMITLEDLLEEIVGEIRDEYDADEEEDFKEIVPKREYLAKGSAKLDDLNEALDLHLETEDYDSIGGFVIEQLDHLPVPGESCITDNHLKLVVDQVDKNRIELVHIYIPEDFYDKKEEED